MPQENDLFDELFEYEKLPQGVSRISSEVSFVIRLFVIGFPIIALTLLINSILKQEALFTFFCSFCLFIAVFNLISFGLWFYDSVYIDYTNQMVIAKGNIFRKKDTRPFYELQKFRKSLTSNIITIKFTDGSRLKFKGKEKGYSRTNTMEELKIVSMIVNRSRIKAS